MVKKDFEQQFLQMYDAHADAIFRYCYWRVFDRDKAKDVVQEAYARTWKYISQGNQIENLRAFVYKTARNIIIDESRKKKSFSLNQIMEKGFTPSIDNRQKMEQQMMGQEMLGIIHSLDEKYRDVILLKYVEDLSTKEISQVLGETENNIYVRLNRGFEQVKKILAKNDEKPGQLDITTS